MSKRTKSSPKSRPPRKTARRKTAPGTKAKTRAKRSPRTDRISGQRALAAEFGVTQPAVCKWLDHPDWVWGRGPWPRSKLPEIAAFLTQLRPDPNRAKGQRRSAADDRPRRSRIEEEVRKIAGQADEIEFRLSKGLRSVHDVAECERTHIASAHEIKGHLLRIPGIVDRFSGLSDAQRDELRDAIKSEIDAALDQITRGAIGPFAAG